MHTILPCATRIWSNRHRLRLRLANGSGSRSWFLFSFFFSSFFLFAYFYYQFPVSSSSLYNKGGLKDMRKLYKIIGTRNKNKRTTRKKKNVCFGFEIGAFSRKAVDGEIVKLHCVCARVSRRRPITNRPQQ